LNQPVHSKSALLTMAFHLEMRWKLLFHGQDKMYTREEMIKFGKDNFEEIFYKLGKTEQGSLLGNIAEVFVVKQRIGAKGTDVSGSDMIDEDGLQKEIKSCWSYNSGCARWGNITSKFGKCEAFIFVDGVANKEYEIPHDVVFTEIKITPASGGEIRTTKHNIDIFEKYEIK